MFIPTLTIDILINLLFIRPSLARYESYRISGTQTRSTQDNNEDGNNDANKTTVIDLTILAALVTAFPGAITTIVSNTTATQPVSVKLKTHSSVIDPYNSKYMDLSTKEVNYQWYIVTNPGPVWFLTAVILENMDKLMDLFKYHTIQFFLNSIIKNPNAVTGAFETAAQTIVGVDHWNVNLSDYKNLLTRLLSMVHGGRKFLS